VAVSLFSLGEMPVSIQKDLVSLRDWIRRMLGLGSGFAASGLLGAFLSVNWTATAQVAHRQVLAFYYGWYGNPASSGAWRHWSNVDAADQRIANSTEYPAYGAYDSHDPVLVGRQAEAARAAGMTGFIVSWWGRNSFEDQGVKLLLEAGGRNQLTVSAYYEKVDGDDAASRIKSAVTDLDYLLTQYGDDRAWLRANGKPVVFVYGRAVMALSPSDWRAVATQVRRDNPHGVVLIADSLAAPYDAVFDGASTYNVTGQIQHKNPDEARTWARRAYPQMVAAAGTGKISAVTVIPGYDDRKVGRPSPRPVAPRWGGELYRALWEEAIAANPNYILITSWNEWHEGSELEPSIEYGSTILNATAAFAKQFLGQHK
jgi:glycoprotein endo-alpha-1,2-mannosidase